MPRRKQSFGGSFDSSFKGFNESAKSDTKKFEITDASVYDFTPNNKDITSEIRFYDHDGLWPRWRRGYELYSLTQTYLGSSAKERNTRGDFRMYLTFQQFPGLFIPARIFTFPSSNPEIGEHIVGIRDTNSFSFYDYALPIEQVRYLTNKTSGTYIQTGTTITVTQEEHGLYVGDSVFLNFTSGAALDETLTITATTLNSFTVTASSFIPSTGGNVDIRQSTSFTSPLWTETRVKLRSLPTQASFFNGERLADRVLEKDPGISFTYTQYTNGLIEVVCSSEHGLADNNEVYLDFLTGTATSGLYQITVTSSTEFSVNEYGKTIPSISTGTGLLQRRIRGFDYNDYVGYTVTGIDLATEEIIFQRADSYGSKVINDIPAIVTPAHRGFTVGRYLTTEIRYQCNCSDFSRRENFNLYKEGIKRKFPVTPLDSLQPGSRFNKDGTIEQVRDDVGVYSEFGYIVINNFYNLPGYEDSPNFSGPNLLYYQARWCKHIYAAMWSVVHDEGNERINLTGRYIQTGGPNITITVNNHGLEVNTKVNITVTSGNALSGEYVITEIIDDNNFVIVYPFNETTGGYCKITNPNKHEYINAWLLEPNDQPIGSALEKFYERLEKSNEATKKQAERLSMLGYGLPWTGQKTVTGDRNLPQDVGNFDPNLISMSLTDSVKRANSGGVSRDGVLLNKSTTLLLTLQKIFNVDINLIQEGKIGILNQPLTDYVNTFQFGEIDGGEYLNGDLIVNETSSELDCKTYDPVVNQETFVDSGLYINT